MQRNTTRRTEKKSENMINSIAKQTEKKYLKEKDSTIMQTKKKDFNMISSIQKQTRRKRMNGQKDTVKS